MLTTKHDDPNAALGWGERLAYGSGGFAFNMINGILHFGGRIERRDHRDDPRSIKGI